MRWADAISGGEGGRDFPGANRLDLTGTGPQVTGFHFTAACFAQPDAGTTNNHMISRWNGATAVSSYLMGGPPVAAATGDGGSTTSIAGTKTFPFGGPLLHHYCMTQGSTALRAYIDGKLDAHGTTTKSLVNAGTPCVGDAALALPYNGVIRHAAIWDAELSPWEVMQLVQGVAPCDVRGAKLRVWIPLSDWAGGTGTAKDLSTRNSSATPAGGTTYAPRPASAAPKPIDPLATLMRDLPIFPIAFGLLASAGAVGN